ncbi:hypothetical protein [Micrococcus luteus]|uniref:hypothetical protein n=1 Tax=Micrococcus luteus TaxID=1270 RepID=UPI00044C16A8|nr:hypothetical protein [Micrococcus luteus]EZP62320.1 hypothetical protein BW40_00348 [Micrococcus luteus]
MNIPNMEERRPHTLGTASNPTDPATTREPESAPILPEAADLLEGVHVLIVAVQEPERVRYRRRFMLSLDAAEKAMNRAVMRGHRASIVLARINETETVRGWEAA